MIDLLEIVYNFFTNTMFTKSLHNSLCKMKNTIISSSVEGAGARGVVGIFIFAGIFQKVAEMSLKKVVDRG